MSLTGTRKDPFLLPDSLVLNNIRGIQALISLPFCLFYFLLSLNLLDFLLNSRLHVAEGKLWRKCKILIHLSAR